MKLVFKKEDMLNDGDSPMTSAESQDDEPPGRPLPACPSHSSNDLDSPSASVNHNDWKWQIRNRLRSAQQLAEYLPGLKFPHIDNVIQKFPMAITPYYASLIRKADISDPVFAMAVPQPRELIDPLFLCDDPLSEDEDMPVPGMVHRYRDRVLLIATTMCSMYCRHCTRKRIAGSRESSISPQRIRQVTEYLRVHPEVNDVIVSGGDPLTMSDDSIEMVLSALRSVPTVQVIRIGTRVPVVLPMRITDNLVNMLKKYHPLWINTHFNHPNEITPQAKKACEKLADAGIPLGSQTVLLKDINDSVETLKPLFHGLLMRRVRPYYLYQCDPISGSSHFRTSVDRGLEIMRGLRGHTTGYAVPTYVIDAPGGGGKIPLLPDYVVGREGDDLILKNFEGNTYRYTDPDGTVGTDRTLDAGPV